MRLLNKVLYIEFAEMVAAGVSVDTLKDAKKQNRSGWKFENDPSDKRKVLVAYEELKPKYKELVLAKYGNPYEYVGNSTIKQYLKPANEAAEYYLKYKLDGGKGIPERTRAKYVEAVQWLNLIDSFTSNNGAALKAIGITKGDFWKILCSEYEYQQQIEGGAKLVEVKKGLLSNEGIDIPYGYTALSKFRKAYSEKGYEYLISGKFGGKNSEKISAAAGDWLCEKYGTNTMQIPQLWMEYNLEAKQRSWPTLKDSNTIYQFLHRADNIQKWYASRYGEKKYKERFAYMLRTDLPEVRDALWYGDGTKLNYYYQDAKGKVCADLWVYEVIDTYSEVLLGYSLGYSEDFIMQYQAYRMAIEFSQAKPYELRYDGQGGHKKIKEGFLDKLTKVAFKCQPHNGKSKTIENIFGRLQAGYMRRDWFFTGMNITATSNESHVDIEYIKANKKALPNREQVEEAYRIRRNEWNNAPHPKKKSKSRLQVYLESVNPEHQPVGYLDMVEAFWLEKPKVTYHNFGLIMELRGEKYEYEVLKDGMPDMEMRKQLIDQEFTVRYDPSDLTHIRLYTKTPAGLQFVTVLEPRIHNPRAIIDYKPGDAQRIKDLLAIRKAEIEGMKEQRRQRQMKTGVSKDALAYDGYGDIQKHFSSYTEPVEAEEWDLSDPEQLAKYMEQNR